MHSKVPPRNRLAKILPLEFRKQLEVAGVARRRYTAILRTTLTDGTVIEDMIVEQGWIVGLSREGLVGNQERRIALDPRDIATIEIVQSI